jgi:hypothetical protein
MISHPARRYSRWKVHATEAGVVAIVCILFVVIPLPIEVSNTCRGDFVQAGLMFTLPLITVGGLFVGWMLAYLQSDHRRQL